MKSIRTIQLSGTIARDGCDILEANANAVAVEDNLAKPKFQLHFEEQIKFDPNMTKKLGNISVAIGTLSHGHFNCTMRNMLGGQKGCECGSTVVEGTAKEKPQCKCLCKATLDMEGRFSMDMILTGLMYERRAFHLRC